MRSGNAPQDFSMPSGRSQAPEQAAYVPCKLVRGGGSTDFNSSNLLNSKAIRVKINPPGEQLKAVAESVAPMHLEFQHAKGADLSQASH